MRNSKGFTLIEIIVAVALVAILSAAIAPSVINNIAQGRMARAASDTQALAQAIMRFRSEVGYFPNHVKFGVVADRGKTCQFLATDGATADAATIFPAPNPSVALAANWPDAWTDNAQADNVASCEDFSSQLIMGSGRANKIETPPYQTADYLYTTTTNPDDPNDVGFRGAVITNGPLDPWGHVYMCNIGALGLAGQPVWVISAGPNGLVDTGILGTHKVGATGSTGCDFTLGNDDIGFRLQ
ncbi:MAG TPA: prepilin-type N-terminal cleavage/methylation domain-containing protein [archaeon]|nr:prepilin-type N-terminal cleavage/methylation domain-containing protein [archaeon]